MEGMNEGSDTSVGLIGDLERKGDPSTLLVTVYSSMNDLDILLGT